MTWLFLETNNLLLLFRLVLDWCAWSHFFFFNAVLSIWKWRWPFFLPFPSLLTPGFIVGKYKTTIPCQFFLLVLPYPRPYLWKQTELKMNRCISPTSHYQLWYSGHVLPCVFEISGVFGSYNSLLYMRSFHGLKVLSSHHDPERPCDGNTGSNIGLTGRCVCIGWWKFDVKQLTDNLQICKTGQWYKCWSH